MINWITLDYLELLCQTNQLLIGCARGESELWISPSGPHPSTLTPQELNDILRGSSLFEVRKLLAEDPDLEETSFETRLELEQQIRQLMN